MPDHDMIPSTPPPTITPDHLDAMLAVCRHWPYPTFASHALLDQILTHLRCLIAQPVPSREPYPRIVTGSEDAAMSHPQAPSKRYPIRVDECFDCDQ